MNRRGFLFGAICLTALAGAPALAQGIVDGVVQALQRDGYQRITVSRTFLGRTRVVGERGSRTREVVLNGRTGEVLRDVVFYKGGTSGVSDQYEDGSSGDGETGNSGKGDDDDSDDDSDDDGSDDSDDGDSDSDSDGGDDD